jgi:hypothetical protein
LSLPLALLATAIAGFSAASTRAQSLAIVVTSCGGSSLTAGQATALYVDVNGNLCNRGPVYGPTAAGSAAANPPILFAGTQNGTGIGTIQIPVVNVSGQLATFLDSTDSNNLQSIAMAATLALPGQKTNGINIGGVEGVSAAGAAASENPLSTGGTAATSAPTLASNGQKVAAQYDPTGKAVTMPYAAPWAQLRGAASSTSTSATGVAGMGAQGASTYLHVVSCQAFRSDTGTTAITFALNDTASTVIGLPNAGGGGGNNPRFEPPLVLAANTGLTFQMSSSVTAGAGYLNCQGFVSATQ